ncbi:MAG TPA: serine hydrolase [Candidatus Kapabacteria bacterium]
MKTVLILLTFLSLNGIVFAQPSADLVRRIAESAALFSDSPGGYDTLFSPEFLHQVSAVQLSGIYSDYFKQYGRMTKWNFVDSSKASSAKVRLFLSKGFTVDEHITVGESGMHLIDGLLLSAATPQIKSLSELTKKLGNLRGSAAFLAAKLSDRGIEPIASLNPDTALALGSAFKLYVLATLLKEINEGKRHWGDVIYYDSGQRAFPSGEMQKWPDHSPVTLATAATLMISISDNTATDLLIHTLGRNKIEAMLKEAGNAHWSRDVPFLTTLEMFKLKSGDATLGKEYLDLNPPQRERFLITTVAAYPHDSVHFNAEITMIDQIEWFASPRDIANVLNYIREHSTTGDGRFVRKILAVNPGLSIDKEKWAYAGYKGGSEPGVLNLSFLLESKNDEWYVLTGTWNDTEAALKEENFEGYMQSALNLVP